MTRQREAEFSELLVARCPLLIDALAQVGHPAIRNRGTIGGSLAHADPVAELPCVMTALDAEFVVAGPGGERVVGASDFFLGPYETALSPGRDPGGGENPVVAGAVGSKLRRVQPPPRRFCPGGGRGGAGGRRKLYRRAGGGGRSAGGGRRQGSRR